MLNPHPCAENREAARADRWRAIDAWRLVAWTCCALALLLGTADPTRAQKDKPLPVLVLPFRVFTQNPAADLPRQIAQTLAEQFTTAGSLATVGDIDNEALAALLEAGTDAIRDYGRAKSAAFVVWGSATWVGERFSIDGHLTEVAGGRTQTVYLDGQRIESLAPTLRSLARQFTPMILKQDKIMAIRVEGNQRIESDAIERVIRTSQGDMLDPRQLAADLKAVFAMGYFDDIRIETIDEPGGKAVVFRVKEKPTVRKISITGNKVFDDQEINETLTLRTGSILNETTIRNNLKRIETLYKDKNYHNVKVEHSIIPLDNNQGDLEFKIEEGNKIRIQRIVFQGNTAVSAKQLKKLIKTSEAWFLSWLTSAGELNQEVLDQDVGQIRAYYNNHGYIQARIADPVIEYMDDGIQVTLKIEEGPQYKVGTVTVNGDLVQPAEDLVARLNIAKETYFSREVVRNDVLVLTDLYADEGYAYAEIVPSTAPQQDSLIVDIDFAIHKGPLVYFEKIAISGNTKTRDKVIRRELEVYEQELYQGAKLKEGVRNLMRLDYFEDVKVDTPKGSADDKMILKLDVVEKPTGAFTFGGGYSSVEDVFTVVSVSQRNFLGKGQTLQAQAQIGGSTTKFDVRFTEPWMFDIPLTASADLYNWETEYDTYDKDSVGAGLRLSYPFWKDVRLYWGYRYDISDISEITDDASDEVRELEGTNTTSSTEVAIRYDSRNRYFNPTEGSMHGISMEYAGLGGDVGFIKTEVESGWYFPLFKRITGFLRAKGGYVTEAGGKLLPDYEKFYKGGINSLRGFRWKDLAPSKINSQGYLSYVGGEKYVQFNAEAIFPIEEKMGVMGVVFFDTGEVFSKDEDLDFGNLRESVGAGIRWYSPVGPIRVEYGHILDPKTGAGEGGRWEFTMGTTF